jgi:hypothetical protein
MSRTPVSIWVSARWSRCIARCRVVERAFMTLRACKLGTSVRVCPNEESAYGYFMSQPRTGVTAAAAIARSLALLLSGRVRFVSSDIGRTLTMEDGKQFSVFRHATMKAPASKHRSRV